MVRQVLVMPTALSVPAGGHARHGDTVVVIIEHGLPADQAQMIIDAAWLAHEVPPSTPVHYLAGAINWQ